MHAQIGVMIEARSSTLYRRNIGVVQRRQDFRPRAGSGPTPWIVGKGIRKHLQRHVAFQFGVARPIHLAPAYSADGREDFVVAKLVANRKRLKSINKSIALSQRMGPSPGIRRTRKVSGLAESR